MSQQFPPVGGPPLHVYEPDDSSPDLQLNYGSIINRLTFSSDVQGDTRPATACDALPGTPSKVEVMRERIERGETIDHVDDPNVTYCKFLGMRCQEAPENGAASWINEEDLERRAASTTFWAVVDELEEHEADDADDPPEEMELSDRPGFVELHWIRVQHGQGRVVIREAEKRAAAQKVG